MKSTLYVNSWCAWSKEVFIRAIHAQPLDFGSKCSSIWSYQHAYTGVFSWWLQSHQYSVRGRSCQDQTLLAAMKLLTEGTNLPLQCPDYLMFNGASIFCWRWMLPQLLDSVSLRLMLIKLIDTEKFVESLYLGQNSLEIIGCRWLLCFNIRNVRNIVAYDTFDRDIQFFVSCTQSAFLIYE